jgi:hypothetical protein
MGAFPRPLKQTTRCTPRYGRHVVAPVRCELHSALVYDHEASNDGRLSRSCMRQAFRCWISATEGRELVSMRLDRLCYSPLRTRSGGRPCTLELRQQVL